MKKSLDILQWFPTTILRVDGSEFLTMADNLVKSIDWSKYNVDHYKNGTTTYFIELDLPKVDDSDKFVEFLCKSANTLAVEHGVNLDTTKAVMSNLWVNKMNRGARHSRHAHPASHYSGTFYVDTPKDCASIRFHNPIKDLWGLAYPPIEQDNHISAQCIDYAPNRGELLVWNSWLYHEVLENQSDSPRTSISFNIKITDR
jgi:uncharacterized protein (TIGR02466 family)